MYRQFSAWEFEAQLPEVERPLPCPFPQAMRDDRRANGRRKGAGLVWVRSSATASATRHQASMRRLSRQGSLGT
jgi:hypothetical protein